MWVDVGLEVESPSLAGQNEDTGRSQHSDEWAY